MTLVVIFAVAACLGCEPKDTPDFRQHVLDRIGYGPSAWARTRIDSLGGISAYIDEQIDSRSIASGPVESMLDAFPTIDMGFADRLLLIDEMNESMMMDGREIFEEFRAAQILRAVHSHRQLEEVLVNFWWDHFNVDGASGRIPIAASAPFERDTLRPHVLGRFEDMLVAVAKSPAMLHYLDNWTSKKSLDHVPGSRSNENYARELLELHTLGAANYTQEDVVAVTRAFTGWTISETTPEGFRFEADNHDDDSKWIQDSLYIPAGGGIEDGLTVLSYLADHPATAENVARKLVQRFVNEDPPPGLVNRATIRFLATDGDLAEVMREILLSLEFSDPANFRTKVKSPFVFAVSAARALGAENPDVVEAVSNLSHYSGQPLYRMRSPTGYPDRSQAWMGAGALIERVHYVHAWTKQTKGFSFLWPMLDPYDDHLLLDEMESWLFLSPLSQESRAAVLYYASIQPDQVRDEKRLEAIAQAVLSSPEFLRH